MASRAPRKRVVGCPLCESDGGRVIWRGPRLRVVRADGPGDDPDFPAFWRVIWNDHAVEFTDLQVEDRAHCMETVAKVERVIRSAWPDAKINLASIGNMVPHLHWHVIARFSWDSRFPAPIWAAAVRAVDPVHMEELRTRCVAVDQHCQDVLTSN